MTWDDYKDAFPAGRNIVESRTPTSDPQEPAELADRLEPLIVGTRRAQLSSVRLSPAFADAIVAALRSLAAASPDSAPAGLDVELLLRAVENVEWSELDSRGPAPNRDTYRSGVRKQFTKFAAEYERLRATPASTTGPAHEAGK